ncbi:MAG TPA: hypothetical protein VMV69_21980 [Pirellulales bacterium]|nr:hypothetical protein [Pirellulales bacterium]
MLLTRRPEASHAAAIPAPSPSTWRRYGWALALAGALTAGAVLRLAWAGDMEYKLDERWMFEQTQAGGIATSEPWTGMPASIGCNGPGMSVWVFVALAWLCEVNDPPALVRIVEVLNVGALLLHVVLAWRFVPRADREPWYWSAALLAVNPLAVLYHRKIWPPSVLPVFVVVMLMCWFRRERRGAAFGWGLIGAILGQIHMGGFHFAAGLALWTRLFDRQRIAWRSWFVGSALGALPLLPWLAYLVRTHGQRPPMPLKWGHLFEAKFWIHWVREPFGIGIDHPLGEDFGDFLSQPRWHDHPTWLVAALHIAAVVAGVYVVAIACRRRRTGCGWRWITDPAPTALVQNAVLWGYGMLLTLSLVPIHRHYQIIALPIEMLWVARLTLGTNVEAAGSRRTGRALLAGLCLIQLAISASFLSYVHSKQEICGEYGTAYGAQ